MNAKSIFSRAVATVTPIFAAFGGFLTGVAPPTGALGQGSVVGIAMLGSVAILLLVMAAARNWDLQQRKRFFLPISVVSLVLGLIGFLLYHYWMGHYVVAYPPEAAQPIRYVIGTKYTADAEKYVQLHPEVAENPITFLRKFGGDPKLIWTSQSIETTRAWLVAGYTTVALLLAGTLLCIAEGILVEPKNTSGEPQQRK